MVTRKEYRNKALSALFSKWLQKDFFVLLFYGVICVPGMIGRI